MNARRTALVLTAAAAVATLSGAGISAASSSPAPSTSAAARLVNIPLAPSNAALAACFPGAHAHVNVALTTDAKGKDTFRVLAENMKPNTDFTVFLLQQSGSPFGAAEYLGDVRTNASGDGTGVFTAIVEEAFAFNNATGSRTDLNAIGMWFADPRDDNGCLGAGSPVTGFDGDASAGVQMLNSGTRLLP